MSKRRVRTWPLYLIGSSAAVAVWSGWVGLGAKSGFGIVHPLPGIWDSFYVNTAITLPIGVESYGAYAMSVWMSPETPKPVRTFARRSALGSLLLGMLGQISYHLLAAFHVVSAPWPIVMSVSCMPVVTLGFAAALIHMLHLGHADEAEQPLPQPEPVAPTVAAQVAVIPEPEDRPMPRLRRTLDSPAPWDDDENWTRPAPPQAAHPAELEPDAHQPVGSVSVRSPLSRLDRKIPVDDRVAARTTGSIPVIRD